MAQSTSYRPLALAFCWIGTFASSGVWAQTRPEPIPSLPSAVLQEPPNQIEKLPELGPPKVTTPPVKRALVGGDIKVTPSGFRFTGNTLLTDAELQAVAAPLIGKQTDFNALADAAASLRQLYASKGFVLTDVYLPEQQFSATGGIVEFAVVEARIGAVSVTVAEGSGVSQSYASALAQTFLPRGALITQYMLDKPVLLLRDMPGTDAEATVVPGANPGEANIEIAVVPRAPRFEPYVSVDNNGFTAEGEYQFAAGIAINSPFGLGDVLTARIQATNLGGNALGRVGYGLAVGSYGTKVIAAYNVTEYKLGEQFAALDATGRAQIASLTAVQPLVRGRYANLFGSIGIEEKKLRDEVGEQSLDLTTRVTLGRFSLFGNQSDSAFGAGSTSLALSVAPGNARLDPDAQAADADPSGPHVAGSFYKVNVELQRVQYLSEKSSVLARLNGQYASKNLVSAEKFYLGGPQGVVGYPVGTGVGDQGFTFALEYRYLTGLRVFDEGLTLTAFYNYGWIQYNKVRNDTTLSTIIGPNSLVLDSAGIGAMLGREGNYVATLALASRLGGPPPGNGESDARTRLWFLLQKWF